MYPLPRSYIILTIKEGPEDGIIGFICTHEPDFSATLPRTLLNVSEGVQQH